MEDILKGLERKDYDAAIGAITITPARLARVDFSYPAHRSGVAVAVRQDAGPMSALASYGSVLGELTPLVALTFALLIVMGVAMWLARAANAASWPRVGRRHSARRHLLGGRDDDDGRLWRQDGGLAASGAIRLGFLGSPPFRCENSAL